MTHTGVRFRTRTVKSPADLIDKPAVLLNQSVNFRDPNLPNQIVTVKGAGASIQSWTLEYSGGADHNINKGSVIIKNVKPNGSEVTFDVEFVIQDDFVPSKPFKGSVDVLVTAFVEVSP